MGREWLFKVTGAGDGGKSPSVVTGKKEKYKNTWSSGCMSAIYNLFDVHHHQFRFHHPSFMSSESGFTDYQHSSSFSLQGIEAPRNSLESPQTNLNIPVAKIQIKTNRSNFIEDLYSESCNSPSVKTPNLVARLMGLDLLPEYSSPRASASSVTTNANHHTRSLPVTPRVSTAGRRSTDNDYHHRLSLQIDKENNYNCSNGQKSLLQSETKQIMVQTRERSSRRLGTDITNSTMSPTARGKCHRRDLNLVLVRPKKGPVTETIGKAKRDESRELTSSPKLRLLDIKSNLNKPVSNSNSRLLSNEVVKSKCQTVKMHQKPVKKLKNVVKDEKIKRIASERYDLRLKKMSQLEKSTALPKKCRSFKKEMTSSCSTKRLSQKQVSLPSNQKSSYKSNDTHNLKAVVTTNTTTTCSSNPLQPSIYHQLEKHRHPTVAAATATSATDCEWDMGRSMWRLLSTEFMTDLVVELESEILKNLVHEIVTEMVGPAVSDMVTSHVRFS
ncbi:hypothetical protein HanPI659440_Chr15g0606601 [Helianthus annuus]|nr:hypothetical protein HanPI659440_Chr15g0606601 [Helianthus annuus]